MTTPSRLSNLSAAEKQALLARLLQDKARLAKSYPLSFAQERLWFLEQLRPGMPIYNLPATLRLPGPLNVPALERAVTEIVRRHEVLRTTFPAERGRPVQRIAPAHPVPLPRADLRTLPPEARDPEFQRLIAQESRHVFDLARGPLLRALLVRVDDLDHVLVLVTHHIVSDGWSTGVLLHELATLHAAFAAGRPSPLPELPLQYADHAQQQRDQLQGDRLAALLGYWRRALDGAPSMLELPTDRRRPTVPSFRGGRQAFVLGREVSQQLESLAHREGATLFMVLLAAFDAWLFRHTGQHDIVVGTPIANRNRTDLEPLIGLFANTLAIRARLHGTLSFRDLVAQVREVTLGAYAHQELPFEKLVEELHDPPCQVMFALHPAPAPAVHVPQTAELSLSIVEHADGLRGTIEYSADLFDHATIARMIGHLQTLLAHVAASPRQPLHLVTCNDTCVHELPSLAGNEVRPVGDGPAPLSFPQERLWFLDQLQPGVPVYNLPFSVRLPAACRVAAVEQALTEIVRRHDVLRTSFPSVDGRPISSIAASEPVVLPIADLRALADGPRAAAIERLFQDEWHHGFDLQRGPLFRARLIRAPASDLLLVNMHHIVSDGRSLGVFVRELSALYEAFAAGKPSPLAELPLRYADHARAQRRRLTEAALAEHVTYWRTQLAGAPSVLELPLDRPRPAERTFDGEAQLFVVPPAVASELTALAQRNGATLFMVLLAAWKTLLHRYTGRLDIVVGTPISNRHRDELEQLIGLFTNTLVLRTSLSSEITFLELVARVREVTLGAHAHQDLPFEQLVEVLQPQRHLDHNPLFQVMFAWQDTPPARSAAEGAGVIRSMAKLDVSMSLGETGHGLTGELEYNTDLFDTASARRMIRNYLELLAAVVAHPDQRLFELPLLSRSEHRQILTEWSGGTADPGSSACVHRLFEAQVDRTPAAIAVEAAGGRSLTYAQLDRRANRLARRLLALGAGPDHPVATCLHRSVDAVVAPLAALKAGAAYVPLDPDDPRARLEVMIEDVAAQILVTDAQLADLFAADEVDDTRPKTDVDPDDLAYVMYPSGSTGRPQGVAMPHRPLVGLIGWHLGEPDLARPLRTLQLASMGSDVAFQEMLTTWCTGGTLVVAGEETRRDPERLLAFIAEMKVQRLFLPPVILAQLAEVAVAAARVPAQILEIITAGEPLVITPAIRAFVDHLDDCVLRNQYGPTETHVVTEHVMRGPSRTWPTRPPIGRPIASARVYILDDHLQLVPEGIPGELYLGGSAVARGYRRGAALTAERFVPDPFSRSAGRLYRTGDLARYLGDGSIQFLGRADQRVKIRGFRIECGEVEAALAEHPAVRGAAVVARDDPSGHHQLIAHVVPQRGATPTDDDLRRFLRARLPEHMIPGAFVSLHTLPLSPGGKLDRSALPGPDRYRLAPGRPSTGPRNSLEATLAAIWREVLQIPEVGVHDSFFDLGGHSRLATRIMSRVRAAFGVEVPLRRLFERPSTIADLAVAVVEARARALDPAHVAALLDEV